MMKIQYIVSCLTVGHNKAKKHQNCGRIYKHNKISNHAEVFLEQRLYERLHKWQRTFKPPVHKPSCPQDEDPTTTTSPRCLSLQPDRKWRTKLGNPSNSESAGVEGLNRAHTHSRLRLPGALYFTL
jgi:hypothetical protein